MDREALHKAFAKVVDASFAFTMALQRIERRQNSLFPRQHVGRFCADRAQKLPSVVYTTYEWQYSLHAIHIEWPQTPGLRAAS
jgi:hypothetical protein